MIAAACPSVAVRGRAPPSPTSHIEPLTAPFDIDRELPRNPTAVAAARAAVRQTLPEEVDQRTASDLALVVAELVANAVEHGEGAIRLRLRLAHGQLTGEVIDEGHGFERHVREAGVDEIRGRGLLIVDALSSSWGIHEGTTHVWFEMDLNAPPATASGPALGESERPAQLPSVQPPGHRRNEH